MQIPRLMIAAPQGRSGKTTVTVGLCSALRRKGFKVKPFKKGPDYIDPSWLAAAAGCTCSNLDAFMFDESTLNSAFVQGCNKMGIAVIEASMGLYDSPADDGHGSSAWLSRLLKVPVILVVNASRMARSAAAMVSGYINFEPGTNIAGVILNNVTNQRHRGKLVRAIETHCGIPVLGCIPHDKRLALRERHIGIVPFIEQAGSEEIIDHACTAIENSVDLDRIIAIENTAPGIGIAGSARPGITANCTAMKQSPRADIRIGVLNDKAFSFYYPENLEALQQAGAELFLINSFTDRLPDVNGLYIGGGFPELYTDELEANASLRLDIARTAQEGLPINAECAGLMYLCNAIVKGNRRFRMAGVFDEDVEITARPLGHGYMEVVAGQGNPFFRAGTILKGHEFHYSRLTRFTKLHTGFNVRRGQGIDGRTDGAIFKNTLATYMHLHALSAPDWAPNFVKLAISHKTSTQKIAA